MRPRHCAASAAKPAPRARRSRDSWCRSGCRDGIARATPAAAMPSIMGSRLRMTRSASRCARRQDRGRGGDRLVAAHRAPDRHHGGDRIAREAHDEKPMVAFQKPITDHGMVTANSSSRMKSSMPKPPADSANGSSQTARHGGEDDQAKKTRRPVSGRRARRRRREACGRSWVLFRAAQDIAGGGLG